MWKKRNLARFRTMIWSMWALVTLAYGRVIKPIGGPQYITVPVAISVVQEHECYLYDYRGCFSSPYCQAAMTCNYLYITFPSPLQTIFLAFSLSLFLPLSPFNISIFFLVSLALSRFALFHLYLSLSSFCSICSWSFLLSLCVFVAWFLLFLYSSV